MKVTLDVTQLLEAGTITKAEHDRFLELGAAGTGSTAFNILVGFGVIAVAGGGLALFPDPISAMGMGLASGVAGILLGRTYPKQWGVLAGICILLGALFFGGGIMVLGKGSPETMLVTALVFLAGGVFGRSALLVCLATLVFAGLLGNESAYQHASYFLIVRKPTLTVIVFTIVAILAYQLSKRLPADYERLAIAVSRSSVFLVNFGFWVGSLWGDDFRPYDYRYDYSRPPPPFALSSDVFTLGWAIALIVTMIWAVKANRRWLVNVVAVFGSIHFYSQWFENLGASPVTVLLAGLLAIGIAVGIRKYNQRARAAAA